ncbi:hypothetical protein GC101_29165 [Paenibacillus sp. LMG 31459]|uniref:Uncharacterized protein n=1 Tax=Paenibacillus phytohabitans TaxID=2654978 RepID=A0ABX1YTM8_9BACL|nr:hypothetical protein [Paenibacillus phytohabitans]NOU82939.1 hypothetical protein [Paenibacillus phytohabitans]
MKISIKSVISTLVALCLMFVVITNSVSANDLTPTQSSQTDTTVVNNAGTDGLEGSSVILEDNKTGEYIKNADINNLTVVENNDTAVTVSGEKDGVQAYVTYDRVNQKVTAQIVEKPQNVLRFSFIEPIKSEYEIDIKTAVDGEISAVATNTETNEVLTIQDSNPESDTAQAQAVILIPVAEWLGALILATLATASIMYIGEMVYVNLKDSTVEKESQKDPSGYYYAYVDNSTNNIFVGPKVNYNAALSWLRQGTSNNVLTPTRSRALTLATNFTNKAPIEHINEYLTKGEGYLRHFHPYNQMFVQNKMPNHIWYLY